MNHPNREEWMSFLYDDIAPTEKNPLTTHLDSCDACRRQVAAWRGTMGALNQWSVEAKPARRQAAAPWVRWAAAASIFVAVGVSIGAAMRGPSSERAEIQKLRQQLDSVSAMAKSQRETLDVIERTIAESRTQDHEALLVTLREMEVRHQADLRNIRKDLETVAVATEQSLDNTHNQLVRLASYTAGN